MRSKRRSEADDVKGRDQGESEHSSATYRTRRLCRDDCNADNSDEAKKGDFLEHVV